MKTIQEQHAVSKPSPDLFLKITQTASPKREDGDTLGGC